MATQVLATQAELDLAQRCAAAETAFSAAFGDIENPWAGSMKRLADLENQKHTAAQRALGERLAGALKERLRLLDEIQAAQERVFAAAAKAREMEQLPVIMRWRQAPGIAAAFGVGGAFQLYAAWFESSRGRTMGQRAVTEFPDPKWPAQLRFDDRDREIVKSWRDLGGEENLASQALQAAQDSLRALLREFPEISGAKLQ
jgi:hypothetical protein